MKVNKEQLRKGQDIHDAIIFRAIEDESFKNDLLNNPRNTIKKFTNGEVKFAKDSRVVVEDQSSPSKVYLNIPRKIEFDNIELDESQLDLVAGGDKIDILLAFGPVGWAMWGGYKFAEYIDS